jgi:23S rRNA (pseudouridine1915-N3)-methyltransferase
MKFRFIWVGKTKDRNWLALQEEYLRRLAHFVRCAGGDGKTEEGKRILDKLEPGEFVSLLDRTGEAFSSPELAKTVEGWQNRGIKAVAFIIGGADGVSPAVAERAGLVLSLSFLTLTHEMARVVMLEQLYRAYTIIRGFPYQK